MCEKREMRAEQHNVRVAGGGPDGPRPPGRARPWRDDRGEVHYLHHLAAHYADVRPDPEAAVLWAQADVRLCRNGATLSLLAWCLQHAGRTAEALTVLDEAFALGAGDPRLRIRAREIRRASADGS
jgi:hypothetical protein